MTKLPVPPPHVISTAFDNGEGVLIDVQHKRYYQLNETALLIWQGLEAGQTEAQIMAMMLESFEVTEAQAAASLARLIEELRAQELLGA